MRVFTTIKSLQRELKQLALSNSIGFVPTMGALHEGHLSLIKNAKLATDIVVVSIFVNPTQFDKKEDLENYPNTLQADLSLLEKNECDIVFIPSIKEMYSQDAKASHFNFDNLDKVMEGAHRDGHFDGVGTIVKHLLEIVKPNKAFFGEKDFQQLQIINKLVEKEEMDVEIIGSPIFREEDGLAMSSRNTRLTKEHREVAPFIYQTLQKAKELFDKNNTLEVTEWVENIFKKHSLLELEYFTIANEATLLSRSTTKQDSSEKHRAFIAVFAGDIRLIDNIALY